MTSKWQTPEGKLRIDILDDEVLEATGDELQELKALVREVVVDRLIRENCTADQVPRECRRIEQADIVTLGAEYYNPYMYSEWQTLRDEEPKKPNN